MKHFTLTLTILVFTFAYNSRCSNALSLLPGILPVLPSLPLPKKCPALANSNSCDSSGSSASFPPCSSTVENISTGRPLQGSMTQTDGEFPNWINITLARQGQKLFANNKLSLLLGTVNGLMAVLVVPDIRQVLLFTHNTDTPEKVIRRYLSTGVQTLLWLEDSFDTDQTDNAILTSITNVREIHRTAARNASAKAPNVNGLDLSQYDNYTTDEVFWNAFHADLVASNISQAYRNLSTTYYNFGGNPQPVSQFAQSLTLFGFMGYPFITPKAYSMENVCEDDWMAWLHLLAVIGHGIGIKDEYNIALQPSYSAAMSYLNEVNNQYYIPFFFNIDHGSKVLIETLFQAYEVATYLHVAGIELNLRTFMSRFIHDHFHIETPNINAILTPAQLAANQAWYSVFIPGLGVPGAQSTGGLTMDATLQAAVLALYGPYVTYMDKAKHVYYTGY